MKKFELMDLGNNMIEDVSNGSEASSHLQVLYVKRKTLKTFLGNFGKNNRTIISIDIFENLKFYFVLYGRVAGDATCAQYAEA